MSDFISNPNQKQIEVKKEKYMKKKDDGGLKYCKVSIKGMQNAMKNLTAKEFQVWLYFAKNEAGYEFWLSPAEAQEEYGISTSSFRKAITKLEDEGYLVLKEGKTNQYYFYEIPPQDNLEISVEKVDNEWYDF